MPPYNWIHIESIWWVFGGGLIFATAIILARASAVWSFSFKKISQTEEEEHEFAGEIKERNGPIPIFIWLVAIGYFIWAISYVMFSRAHGL